MNWIDKNAPSPLTRFAIGALFFCLALSIIKFILFGCIFIFAVLSLFLLLTVLFAPFSHFIFLFKEILTLILLLQNSPVFYLQFLLLVCGYSGIEKTESKLLRKNFWPWFQGLFSFYKTFSLLSFTFSKSFNSSLLHFFLCPFAPAQKAKKNLEVNLNALSISQSLFSVVGNYFFR